MKENLQDYLRPIFLVSRLSGVFPYNNDLTYHDILCLFPLVNVALNIAAIYNFLVIKHSSGGLVSRLLDGVLHLGVNTTLICCRSFLVRPRWTTFINITSSIERMLDEKGFHVKHRRWPMVADLCIRISFIAVFCAHPLATLSTPREQFTRLFSVCVPLWFMSVVQLQFVFSVQALRDVCKTLRAALQVFDDKVPLLEMENILISASREVNKLYSIHALFDLAFIFYDVCNGINVFIKSSDRVGEGLIAVEMLFYSFQLWRMASVSSEFYNEVRKFDYTLFEFMMKRPIYAGRNTKKYGTFMCAKHDATFSACGLFKINYELMHSFVAGIGTYVALIQQINN